MSSENTYKNIKVKVNTAKYENEPGKNKNVWITCSSEKRKSRSGSLYIPSCYIYLSIGKAGRIYFFLGKRNESKFTIEDKENIFRIKDFQFNNEKKTISFVYEGSWEDETKTGLKISNVLHNYVITFDKQSEYDKCKENMLPFLELKNGYYQDIGRVPSKRKIKLGLVKFHKYEEIKVRPRIKTTRSKIIKRSNKN